MKLFHGDQKHLVFVWPHGECFNTLYGILDWTTARAGSMVNSLKTSRYPEAHIFSSPSFVHKFIDERLVDAIVE